MKTLYIGAFIFLAHFALLIRSDLVCKKNRNYATCSTESDDHDSVLQRGSVSDDDELEHVIIVGCRLKTIEYESFEDVPNLETLDLSVNVLENLQLGLFNALGKVKSFNLSDNLISELPLGIFDEMPSIESLDLSNNKIKALALGVLDPLINLMSLYLSNNQLTGLPLGLFDKPAIIKHLDLSNNIMTTIPLGIFDSLKSLQVLDLSSSRFSPMISGIFDQSRNLNALYLSNNGINEIPDGQFNDVTRLNTLDLSNNSISVLKYDVFATLTRLKTINLSRNQLSDVSGTLNLPQLSSIEVSENKLETFPALNTTTLRHLDISGNRITYLASTSVPKRLSRMMLHKNPWQCVCLDQLLSVLIKRKINFKESLYFDGKMPVCVVMNEKKPRCVKDSSQNAQLFAIYTNALKNPL